jgi:hypothetical protein
MQNRIKFAAQTINQLKFESYLLNLPRTYAPHHPDMNSGRHMTSVPSSNHAGVQQLAKGPQLCVDAGAVSLII